jgi:hypothetical protein
VLELDVDGVGMQVAGLLLKIEMDRRLAARDLFALERGRDEHESVRGDWRGMAAAGDCRLPLDVDGGLAVLGGRPFGREVPLGGHAMTAGAPPLRPLGEYGASGQQENCGEEGSSG